MSPKTKPNEVGRPLAVERSPLGERIRAARLAAELSTGEAAERAELHQTAWSQYESGRREPGATALATICRALNVSADEILGIAPRKKRPAHKAPRRKK